MSFQDNLRIYREKAGYAQAKDFAASLGIKYTTYIAYEQGREPKYNILCRIAAALGVTTDDLLGYSQNKHAEYTEYIKCKQKLQQEGLDLIDRANGEILAYLGEKGQKNEELERIYSLVKDAPLCFPSKKAIVEIVKGAELDALQASFHDALIKRLLPWFVAAGKSSPNHPQQSHTPDEGNS